MGSSCRRGICTVCGKDCALNMDGTVRGHGWRQYSGPNWCPGSWLLPKLVTHA